MKLIKAEDQEKNPPMFVVLDYRTGFGKLVQKASKGSRSVNEYIQTLIENDLIKRKMLKKSERKKLSSKTQSKESVMATLRYLRGKWYAEVDGQKMVLKVKHLH